MRIHTFVGNRLCSEAAGFACTYPAPNFKRTEGGINIETSVDYANIKGQGAFGAARANFGDGYLPEVHGRSFSVASTRTGVTVSAFRTFTYNGSGAIDLALTGLLDFANSGDVPGNDMFQDGELNILFSIQPRSAINGFTLNSAGGDILNSAVPFADCSSGAIAFTDYQSTGTTNGGTKTANLSLSTGCNGNKITIAPGESFVVVATLQAISNRGGFIDASNTFKVQYDLLNTVYTDTGLAVGAHALRNAITAPVPEPGTWLMMISGFGVIGLAARRRNHAGLMPA